MQFGRQRCIQFHIMKVVCDLCVFQIMHVFIVFTVHFPLYILCSTVWAQFAHMGSYCLIDRTDKQPQRDSCDDQTATITVHYSLDEDCTSCAAKASDWPESLTRRRGQNPCWPKPLGETTSNQPCRATGLHSALAWSGFEPRPVMHVTALRMCALPEHTPQQP